MEVLATGVFRMTGTSKETGKPYDFAQLMYLRRIEPVATDKMQLRGFGFETAKCDLANDSLEKFNQVPFPVRMELLTDTVPSRTGFRTIVVDFKLSQQKAA